MHRTCVSHLHRAIISATLSPPVLGVEINTPLKIQQERTLFIWKRPPSSPPKSPGNSKK